MATSNTTNVRTPWQDLAEFQKLGGRQSDVQDVIQQLQGALDPTNLRKATPYSPEWAKYGYAAVDPGTKTFVEPTMYSNKQYAGSMQKQLSSALNEDAINRAAMELFSPYTPPIPKPDKAPSVPRPRTPGSKIPAMGAAGVIGVLLDLLSYTGSTNVNESEQLQSKRGAELTNKPEYEALLQQLLQSGNATFPK